MYYQECHHEWPAWDEDEERGVLVVTHGRRAGRIFAVEQRVQRRECIKCHEAQEQNTRAGGNEWPGGIR